ncbi:hypothetical protein [Novosphingobium aquae]|uniref:Uncharacterized protein n=1 Tax=Novosphingobium aquae TaxID=3133435 RepID=A0ABU8S6X6_9SPHN
MRALAFAGALSALLLLTPAPAQDAKTAREAAADAAAAVTEAVEAADEDVPVNTEGPRHTYGKPVEFTCPVGGEKFSQVIDAFSFPLETYPDGGGPGSEQSDVQLPECPSNGLVLMNEYKHEEGDSQEPYTTAEIARLPALIATPEYQALRKDSRAARLLWLSEKLGRPAWQRYHLLQRAAWVAKTPADRKRWMTRIADESEAMANAPGFPPDFAVQLDVFRINALRETGRWDEALKAIDALYAKADALRAKRPVNPHVVNQQEDDDGRIDILERMRSVIADKDDDPHPVGMMGKRWANMICRDIDEPGKNPLIGPNTRRGCAKMKADAEFETAVTELETDLVGDVVKRDKICVRTPADKRSKLEARACEGAMAQVEWIADRAKMDAWAKRLLANPAILDVECKAVTIGRYDTPATALGKACQERARALHEKEFRRLRDLMQKNPAEYDNRCTYKYPQYVSEDPLEEACASVKSTRESEQDDNARQQVNKLTPAEIAARCAQRDEAEAKDAPAFPEAKAFDPIDYKCISLRSQREEAEWRKIAADPALLAETCAKALADEDHLYRSRCDAIEEDKLDAEAYKLAKDHTALVGSCQSTPMEQRGRVLAMACERYRKCVIVPVGTRVPQKNMFRGDLPIGYYGEEAEKRFLEGEHGDGTGRYCYDMLEEANAAWELVKDPAKRVIDPVDLGAPYSDRKIKAPKAKGKSRPASPPVKM